MVLNTGKQTNHRIYLMIITTNFRSWFLIHRGEIFSHRESLVDLDIRQHLIDKQSNEEQEGTPNQFSGKFIDNGVPIIAIPADFALGGGPGNEGLTGGISGISNRGDPGRVHSISLGWIVTFCGATNPGRHFTIGGNGTSTGIGSTCTLPLLTLQACRCVSCQWIRGLTSSLVTVSYLSACRWGSFSASHTNNTDRGSFNNWHFFIAHNAWASLGGGSSSSQLIIVNFAADAVGQGIDTVVVSQKFSTDLTHLSIMTSGTVGRNIRVAPFAVVGGKTSSGHGERGSN